MTDSIDMSRVISIADAMKDSMERINAMAAKTRKCGDFIRREMKKVSIEKCPTHGVELAVDQDGTFTKTWFNPEKKLIVVYQKCPKCAAEARGALVNERFIKMGIPKKVVHATLENFITDADPKKIEALEVAKRQSRIGDGFLILRGGVGTGKSHLAAAILKMHGGLFVTLGDLVGELRNTYDEGGQEAMVKKYRNVKCLVIDELALEVKGTDIPSLLYRVLAYRYDRGLETIITSNEPKMVICDILGERLVDRIKGGYRLANCDWASYRHDDD